MSETQAGTQKARLEKEVPRTKVIVKENGNEYSLIAENPYVSPAPIQELDTVRDVDEYIERAKRRNS